MLKLPSFLGQERVKVADVFSWMITTMLSFFGLALVNLELAKLYSSEQAWTISMLCFLCVGYYTVKNLIDLFEKPVEMELETIG